MRPIRGDAGEQVDREPRHETGLTSVAEVEEGVCFAAPRLAVPEDGAVTSTED